MIAKPIHASPNGFIYLKNIGWVPKEDLTEQVPLSSLGLTPKMLFKQFVGTQVVYVQFADQAGRVQVTPVLPDSYGKAQKAIWALDTALVPEVSPETFGLKIDSHVLWNGETVRAKIYFASRD